MKSIQEYIISETQFCKPNDVCYIVIDKDGQQKATYLPFTGFGEDEKLKEAAIKMAKYLGDDHTVKEVLFKDIQEK